MASNRWKPPVLAVAALLVFPLFGCASRQATVSVQLSAVQPATFARWTAYRQLLDRRIAGQWTVAQLAPDQLQVSVATAADEQQIFDRRVLAAHNRERNGLGLVPLSWNPALARSARRWADYLAATGRFEHAPESRFNPEGENLWAGTKGYYSPEAMVNAWIREKKYFRPGTFPDNSTTGRVEDVGHYTQVVWRATTQVGCAEARSRSEDILVCRYAEAGNYRGEAPF